MSTLVTLAVSIPLIILCVVGTILYAVHKMDGVNAEFSLGPFRFALRASSLPKCVEPPHATALGQAVPTANKLLVDHDTTVTREGCPGGG